MEGKGEREIRLMEWEKETKEVMSNRWRREGGVGLVLCLVYEQRVGPVLIGSSQVARRVITYRINTALPLAPSFALCPKLTS